MNSITKNLLRDNKSKCHEQNENEKGRNSNMVK